MMSTVRHVTSSSGLRKFLLEGTKICSEIQKQIPKWRGNGLFC